MPGFYDDLAPYYHVIFADWDASIAWQGEALSAIIAARWPACRLVLDVSCGIGTQSLALAMRGYDVRASDISSGAVERARKEAAARGLRIAISVCDVREAFAHHGAGFDVVVCCDNSIPHLLTDGEILSALVEMSKCLRPGGGCIVTVRDYDQEPRGRNIVKPVRCATRSGVRHLVTQVWDFDDDGARYDLSMYVIEERMEAQAIEAHVMRSRYYAIGLRRLEQLMNEAGFREVATLSNAFYQPVLVGTRPLAPA